MRIRIAILLMSIAVARADFVDDQYTEHPDVLFRIVAAAHNDKRLNSYVEDDSAFYLRRAEYIGPLPAPFGTVHVAQLLYVRSAPRGTKLPPRRHTLIVFFDQNFKIRQVWSIDLPSDSLYVDGTKLVTDKTIIMDFAHIPKNGAVLFDGKVLAFPEWN